MEYRFRVITNCLLSNNLPQNSSRKTAVPHLLLQKNYSVYGFGVAHTIELAIDSEAAGV